MGHFERSDENGEARRRDRRSSKRRNRRDLKLGAECLEQRVLMRASPLNRSMLADAIVSPPEARAERLTAADLLSMRLARAAALRSGRSSPLPEATRVPGDAGSTTTATFTLVARRASYRNEVGVFVVDDAAGRIGGLRPGDRGYAAAALSRAQVVFRRAQNAGAASNLELPGGSYFGIYLVQNGSSEAFLAQRVRNRPGGRAPMVFFSFTRANADRVVHIRQPHAGLLRMEDRWRGGDRDFDDAIVQMTFKIQDPSRPSDGGEEGGGPDEPINGSPSTNIRLARDTARRGLTNDDRITSDPSLVGSVVDPDGDPIRSLRLRLDGDASAVDVTGALASGGTFTLDRSFLESALGRAIADGPHVAAIQAEDARGAVSAWGELAFTLDTTPPPLTLQLAPGFDSTPVGDGATRLDVVRLIGATEPGLVVALGTTGRTAQADANGAFAFDDVPLPAIGSNSFFATTDDVAGNASEARLDVARLKPCGFDTLDGWTIDAGDGDGAVALEGTRIVLREGTSFQVTLSRTFVVPENPTTIDFRYEDLSFDTSDGGFINDAFEVALLGDNGRTVVPAYTSARDAFFNATEGLQPAVGSGVGQAGGTVTVDVSSLIPGTIATLVFRLVNNDDDTRTSVAIACLDADWEGATVASTQTSTPPTAATSFARSATTSEQSRTGQSTAELSTLAAASLTGDGLLGPDGSIAFSTTADFLAGEFTNTVATDEAGGVRLAPDSQRPTGSWSRVVDGGRAGVNWGGVTVEAETPPGSTVEMRVRAADDRGSLATTPWTVVNGDGRIPGAVGRFLEVETRLRSIADEGTADVVFVVDESGSMAGEQLWLASTIAAIDSRLEEYGFQNNRYGLVGFADTPRSLPDSTSRFMTAQEFATAARSLTTTRSGSEDGYRGLNYALSAYDLRDDAVGLVVLVTDEHRTVVDAAVTRAGMLTSLEESGVVFHAVLNAILADDRGMESLGVDSTGTAYIQDVAGQYEEGSGGAYIRSEPNGGSIDNIRIDYADLAWAVGGTVWDLNKLRDGGEAAAAFTTAFADGLPLQAGNTPIVKSITIQEVSPPTIDLFSPEDGASLAASSGFVLSGLATADQTVSPTGVLVRNAIALVTVNGKPVDALDGAGRFFFRADVRPGDNVFTVVAEDAYGQTSTTTLTITGTQGDGVDFSQFSDVSASFGVDYARTSFRRDEATLYADVAVKNVGQYAVTTPLYVAIANLSDPTVAPLDADGYTPDGLPYYDVSALVARGRLEAGRTADPFTFSFWNPNGVQFDYDLRFFGLLNRAPDVTSVPRIEALVGKTYRYDVDASDPDGDPVSFRLTTAPAGMTIDPTTGVVSWTPAETDPGTHAVVIRVDDGRGGWTEQAFDVETIVPPPDRPPVFTSLPVLDAQIGVLYTYAAAATDPDFDPLAFFLVNGPEGMTVDPTTGVVSWTPRAGQQGEIALRVQDGRGGEATQTFAFCVAEAPGNHAPVIVSQPVTGFVLGNAITIQATIRDFNDTHPDFESGGSGVTTGLVSPTLGADRAPVLVATAGRGRITNADTFAQWFHDVPGVNLKTTYPLVLTETSPGSGIISFSSSAFFPIDGQLFGNQRNGHNYHFTMEAHTTFTYRGGETFDFAGDDDVWVYINDQLVVDLGGTHAAAASYVDIDSLGFTVGETYSFDLFFAERHTPASTLTMQTGLQLVTSESYTYQIAAVDPDGDALSYSLVEAPYGMAINPSTGFVTWNPSISQVGPTRVTVRVSDGRGGFQDQSYDLDVVRQGGDIQGRVNGPGSAQTTQLVVPGTSDPWLAGMPAGSRASATDVAPTHSPGEVLGLTLVPGMSLTFEVSGQVNNVPSSGGPGADGGNFISHQAGSENGIANAIIPHNALVGVFLGADLPDLSSAPTDLDYRPGGNVAGGLDFITTFPIVGQVFFIGNGLTSDGIVQRIVVPQGATRLFLGTMDGIEWSNNSGAFTVQAAIDGSGLGLESWIVYLDQNQNARLDPGESSTVTDANGNYSFTNLPPGTYYIRELMQTGWAQTSPAGLGVHVVTIAGNESVAGIDFGNHSSGEGSTDSLDIVSAAPVATTAVTLLRYDPVLVGHHEDALTFDLPTAPAGMTVHPTLGVIVWTPTEDQVGTHSVVLRVQDGRGGVAIQSFTVTVGEADTAPIVSSTPPGPATVGLPYRYAIAAQDAEGDALAFAFEEQPPVGMTLSSDGVLDWPTAGLAGDYPVVVVVTDARGASTRHAFTLKVAPAGSTNTVPTAKVDARTTAHAGQLYVAMIRAFDPDGDPLSYELLTKPAGMSVDAAGVISWTSTTSQVGGFDVQVKVSDGRPGGDVVRTFHVDVATQGANGAPRVVSVPRLAATAGATYATTLEGSDPDGDPVSFRLVSGPRGMSLDPASGEIRWIPSADQRGPQEVVVEAVDPFLAASLQRFVVVVTCVNQEPRILSTPPTNAWAGDPYLYAVRADDPEDDPLTFTLLGGPEGMTVDPATGVVRWTPTSAQAGRPFTVAIQVDDGKGNVATQSFTVEASAEARNRPPVITSRPSTVVVVDEAFAYAVQATDPEAEPLRFEPGADFPSGMTIDPATGAVSWKTSVGDLGSHIVTIVAVDAGGARATQSFLLDVQENQAPTLRASADPGTITAGSVFRYDVRATDPNGDALSYELVKGPAGMSVDQNGRVVWSIPADARGPYPVQVAVRDPRGAEVVRSFALDVQPDMNSPRVYLYATPGSVNPGSRVVFRVVATDDVLVKSLSLTVDGKPVVLGADGTATVVMNSAGSIDARATATDPSGNVGDAAATVVVVDPASSNAPLPPGGAVDPNDRRAPTVVVTSPAFEASVSDKAPIIGTVDDPEDRLWYYRVLYARVDSVDLSNIDLSDPDWTLLRQGIGEVHNGELAVFDPTHLSRDPYAIVVAAYDQNGQGYVAGVTVDVQGGLLLGNYHFETTDLQVPLAGIPITVTRVYDTANASREGDFGYGWSLGVQDARILETVPAGEDYVAGKTKVYLTAPDGRRIGFTYQEKLVSGSFFGAVVEPYFTPDPGVYETLQVADKQIGRGGIVGAITGPYNPDVFILTTKDGMKYTYDQTAGLQRIDDLNGNFVTFSDQGIKHSSGARIDFTRDYRGRIASITQYDREGARTGGVVRYQYDAAGDLRAVTDQGGLTTSYEYRTSPRHYLDRAIDARGVTVLRVEYEPIPDHPGSFRFVAIKDALGNVVGQNDYSGLDSHTAIVRDGNGNETTFLYDDRGNVLRETDPLGNVTVRTYGDARNPDLETRIVDGRGYIADREYDARGNVTKIIERGTAAAPFASPVVTAFTYDDRNNVRTITNALGQTTTFTYDAKNNLLTIVDALGDSSRFAYDSLGRKKTFTDFNGNISLFEYASEDCGCVNPRKITYADGTYQTYKYNSFGQATEEASYEANGTLVEIKTTTYDALGRVVEEARGLGADRIVTRKVYDKNLLDYEMVVNPASPNETPATPVSQRKSRITDYDYDANGRMIRQVNPDGGAIDFRYDAQGNRVLLRDPVGNVTTWVYDASNRVVEERDPFYWAERGLTNLEAIVAANRLPSGVDLAANRGAEHVTAYGYDAAGNQVEIIDRNGRRREFSFDFAGRTTEERWYDAGTDALGRTMTWRYDTLGNLLEAGDPDSHYTYTYDTLNRVTTVDNAGTPDAPRVVLTYGYDKQGNVLSTSDNSGVTVASEYDARNRLSVRKWYDAAIPAGETADVDPIRIDFHYNAANRQTLLERFSGLDRSTSAGRTVTTYYQNGQVDKLTHLNAVDAVLASYDYDYDFGGLVVGEARTNQDTQYNQTITYAYDLNGQLVDADYDTQPDEHFEYDLNGNRIRSQNGSETTIYTTGTANQLTSDGTYRYEYDGEGNLVQATEVTTERATIYAYNHHNKLIAVEERERGGIPQGLVLSIYDIEGRRIATASKEEATHIAYSVDNTWRDFNQGESSSRYLFGNIIDQLIAKGSVDEPTVLFLSDRLANIRDATDISNGSRNHFDYTSFGALVDQGGTAFLDQHLYASRERISEADLYDYRTRYYLARQGRFSSSDMIKFESNEFNLYVYAKNSPVNFVDPNGTMAFADYARTLAVASTLGGVMGYRCEGGRRGALLGAIGGAVAVTFGYTAYLATRGRAAITSVKLIGGTFNITTQQGFLQAVATFAGVEVACATVDDVNAFLKHLGI